MKLCRLDEALPEPVVKNPAIQKQVLLRKGELGPITQLARASFPPGESAPAHRHPDMAEVFLVESGRGRIVVDDSEHMLEPGVLVVVDVGEEHALENTGREPLVITYFGLAL